MKISGKGRSPGNGRTAGSGSTRNPGSLSQEFPQAIAASLATAGASQLIPAMSAIPPTSAMFAAFLGFNPVQAILTSLPPALVSSISPQILAVLTGIDWFPNTLVQAFLPSFRISFWLGAALAIAAAILSAARGPVYINEGGGCQAWRVRG